MRRLHSLYIIISISLLSAPGAHAQQTGITASFGGGSFRMDDMKYLQENILGSYPVEGKIISSFPVYPYTSVSFIKQIYEHVQIGAGYAFTSTGGRSNYTDYSGSIYTDMIAISHRLGGFIKYTILGNDHLKLSLYGRLDANFSSMKITSSIYVYGISNEVVNSYRSISPNGSAGLELMYRFNDFAIGMDAGYLVDMPGKLKDKESGDELTDPNDRQRILTTDWTGWRAGLKAIVWLNF